MRIQENVDSQMLHDESLNYRVSCSGDMLPFLEVSIYHMDGSPLKLIVH